ncbi:MAG: hypothetical protein M3Y73_05805 [Actinomycetota bacterium]|nr:hypothetical protein [Actinomycetota bacterium]
MSRALPSGWLAAVSLRWASAAVTASRDRRRRHQFYATAAGNNDMVNLDEDTGAELGRAPVSAPRWRRQRRGRRG